MSQNYYKEFSEKLFEKTKWSISVPTFSWVLPELTIHFNYKEVYKIKLLINRDTLKTSTRFKKIRICIFMCLRIVIKMNLSNIFI